MPAGSRKDRANTLIIACKCEAVTPQVKETVLLKAGLIKQTIQITRINKAGIAREVNLTDRDMSESTYFCFTTYQREKRKTTKGARRTAIVNNAFG